VTIFACCGFQDFLVAIHIVAFAKDQGVGTVLSGNLLAFMGVLGVFGVMLSGAMADKWGAVWPTALCFVVRIALFALIITFQTTASIVFFALPYGFTFLITAPLIVVFVGNIFGSARLGSIGGLIGMSHQVAGGAGALTGAVIFDQFDSYHWAFVVMLAMSILAAALTLAVRERPLPAIGVAAPA
jgi:predicted MFS family arabinose efflux permease